MSYIDFDRVLRVLSCLAVKKVVVTAAGFGTRLLPMSKELPKDC
jgi:hypothetical protein